MKFNIFSLFLILILLFTTVNATDTKFGIFYSTWHCPQSKEFDPNITQYELAKIFDGTQELGPVGAWHWIYKPINGYYCLSTNEKVLKKHAEMLRDAGIDFVFIDSTNHPHSQSTALKSKEMIEDPFMKMLDVWKDINGAPKVVPWVPIPNDVKYYDMINFFMDKMINYPEYSDMWFEYNGRKVILGVDSSNDPSKWQNASVSRISAIEGPMFANKFEVKTMWVDSMNPNIEWSFFSGCQKDFLKYNGNIKCNQRIYYSGQTPEQISVTSAYQDMWNGTSIMSDTKTAVPKLGGKTFRKQFETVFENPNVRIVTITGWNALLNIRGCFNSKGTYTLNPSECSSYLINGNAGFHDDYTIEYGKDIEPVSSYGIYSENWYYYNLMKGCIQLFKSENNCSNEPSNICCRDQQSSDKLRPTEICNNNKDDDYDGSIDEGCTQICSDDDWVSTEGVCQLGNKKIVTWAKQTNCEGGVQHPATQEVTCNYQAPLCTEDNWDCDDWSSCSTTGNQTKTCTKNIVCEGGFTPQQTRTCNYVPTCTDEYWDFNLMPEICPSSGEQTKEYYKKINCINGTNQPTNQVINCDYNAPTCEYSYSDYGECVSGLKTRTATIVGETNCQGKPTNLTKTCETIPVCTESHWSFTLSTCTNGTQTKTWEKISECENGITHSNEVLLCSVDQEEIKYCGGEDWESRIEPEICPENGEQIKYWTRTNTNCQAGVTHKAEETITCMPENTTNNNSNNTTDSSNNVNQNVTNNSNYGQEDNSDLCSVDDWVYEVLPEKCPQNKEQLVYWTKVSDCEGGLEKPESEIIECEVEIPNTFSFIEELIKNILKILGIN